MSMCGLALYWERFDRLGDGVELEHQMQRDKEILGRREEELRGDGVTDAERVAVAANAVGGEEDRHGEHESIVARERRRPSNQDDWEAADRGVDPGHLRGACS
jgi:hypothetical protein